MKKKEKREHVEYFIHACETSFDSYYKELIKSKNIKLEVDDNMKFIELRIMAFIAECYALKGSLEKLSNKMNFKRKIKRLNVIIQYLKEILLFLI